MKKKKALFVVNSLSDGGAERVCINMANELLQQNYEVDFILLGKNDKNNKTYKINKEINIYNLNINNTNKIIKIFKILASIGKMNKIIRKREEETGYQLITSHLPMANILTRFSCIKNRALYVFHTKVSSYDRICHKLFFMFFYYIYKNQKIVAVSEGVRQEAINKYKIKEKNIVTIYNPINVTEIDKKSKEKIPKIGKYILQVGRFNDAKRQDRMVDVFFKGELYKKYQLVFCGTGELEESIKTKVNNMGINEKVTFLGWQDNVYKWMKNAELLVSTSDYEAFPMNLMEAIICGTKVVSSNCEFGPNEILLGDYSKYLVKTDDVNDYIEKINMSLLSYPITNNPIIEKCKASNIIEEYLKFMGKERV